MPDLKKHQGGCHCGKVRYEVETDMAQVLSCNCSICQKRGALLTFVGASAFTLLSGEDALSDYQFNKKIIHHLFCRTRGVGSFARGIAPGGQAMVAVNVRCLDDVDHGALKPTAFDGKSL